MLTYGISHVGNYWVNILWQCVCKILSRLDLILLSILKSLSRPWSNYGHYFMRLAGLSCNNLPSQTNTRPFSNNTLKVMLLLQADEALGAFFLFAPKMTQGLGPGRPTQTAQWHLVACKTYSSPLRQEPRHYHTSLVLIVLASYVCNKSRRSLRAIIKSVILEFRGAALKVDAVQIMNHLNASSKKPRHADTKVGLCVLSSWLIFME